MGNHCIDVTCAVCGRTWCERCYDGPSLPDSDRAKRVQDMEAKGQTIKVNTGCCGQGRVYMGCFFMGKGS